MTTARTFPVFLILAGCGTQLGADPTLDTFQANQGNPEVHAPHTATEGYSGGASDADGDGTPSTLDCDDGDADVGALLYQSELADDDGTFSTPQQLDTPWSWDGNSARASRGGQQAVLGDLGDWSDVVVYSDLSSQGSEVSCGFDCFQECEVYEPEDCYTESEALGLGILTASVTGSGRLTFSNSGAFDVCLNGNAMWSNDDSQTLFQGDPDRYSAGEYRVPAGGSLHMYYGSWTTDNHAYSPYLGEEDGWCMQLGTSMASLSYTSIGAGVPDGIAQFINENGDSDHDGVEDHVDWAGSYGVQAQYNVWSYQASHPVIVVGKLADTSPGALNTTLTVQNRGAVDATNVYIADTVPANWSVVSCDVEPDHEVYNDDNTTTLVWEQSLEGCTDDCSVVDELVITCELSNNLGVDVRNVLLPAATADYTDGEDERSSTSLTANAFDYDYDADGEIQCGATDRWRAGVLLRSELDADQNEGFHGYRCALARNKDTDCFAAGHFLQIGAFLDEAEDDVQSECTTGCVANPTFDQLARTNHDGATDISVGDVASLAFYAVGDQLTCQALDASGAVIAEARATDDRFTHGTVGMSTLNMFGDYENIKVCRANHTP